MPPRRVSRRGVGRRDPGAVRGGGARGRRRVAMDARCPHFRPWGRRWRQARETQEGEERRTRRWEGRRCAGPGVVPAGRPPHGSCGCRHRPRDGPGRGRVVGGGVGAGLPSGERPGGTGSDLVCLGSIDLPSSEVAAALWLEGDGPVRRRAPSFPPFLLVCRDGAV